MRKDYIKKVQIIEEEHKKEVTGLRQVGLYNNIGFLEITKGDEGVAC